MIHLKICAKPLPMNMERPLPVKLPIFYCLHLGDFVKMYHTSALNILHVAFNGFSVLLVQEEVETSLRSV